MVMNTFRFIIRILKPLVGFGFQIKCTSRMYAERIFSVAIIEGSQCLKVLIICFPLQFVTQIAHGIIQDHRNDIPQLGLCL